MALIEHGLFGITDKVQESIDLIKAYEPEEGYYVAFSGGKDSIVTLDLVKRSGVKYDAHYMRAMEPPELVYFIRKHYPEVQRHLPKKTMWQMIQLHGIPPLRSMRYCCQELKEVGGKGRVMTVTGVRRDESLRRKSRAKVESIRNGRGEFLHPILTWSEADVWEWIRRNHLPYPSLYDEGYRRIGCVMCPCMGANKVQADAQRWPKIAEAYKRACQRAYDPEMNHTDWKDGNDMYEWWLSGKSRELEGDMLWDENDV